MALVPKKRNRKVLVCTNCRSKKNKCDRNKPCGSCIKLGLQSSCLYAESPGKSPQPDRSVSTQLTSSSGSQKPLGVSFAKQLMRGYVESRSPAVKKFPSGTDVIQLYYFLPLDPKDPASKLLWIYWSFQVRDRQFSQFLMSRHFVGTTLNKIRDLELTTSVPVNSLNYVEFEGTVFNINHLKSKVNGSNNGIGLLYHPNFQLRTKPILEKIKEILPSQTQLITYQKIFFDKLSMYAPILDEFEHFDSIRRIFNITSPNEDRITKFSITSKQDYALIAQVLIILRLSYLYLLSTDTFNISGDDIPIYLEAIELAEECHHWHGMVNQPTLTLLQSLILLQYYRVVSPERQSGFISDQTLRSQILGMAYCLGVHKEPKRMDLSYIDDKGCHLRRKIWYHIYQSNVYFSLLYWTQGFRLEHDFDIEYPTFDAGLGGHRNPINEKKIIDGLVYQRPIITYLSRVLNMCQGINPSFEHGVIEMADGLRLLLDDYCGTIRNTLTSAPGYFKIIKFQSLLYGHICLALLYYSGVIRYEDSGQHASSILCLKQCFEELYGQLGQITLDTIHSSAHAFGKEFKITTSHLLLDCIHLIVTASSMLMIRLKATIDLSADAELIVKLNHLLAVMKKFVTVRIKYLIDLSSHSLFGSKAVKLALNNMLVVCDDDGIYQLFPDKVNLCKLDISVHDVDDLIAVLKRNWTSVEADPVDNVNIFTVADILSLDPNCNEKLMKFVQFDKLWMANTCVNMFKESDVPRDDDDHGKDCIVDLSVSKFSAVPLLVGLSDLVME